VETQNEFYGLLNFPYYNFPLLEFIVPRIHYYHNAKERDFVFGAGGSNFPLFPSSPSFHSVLFTFSPRHTFPSDFYAKMGPGTTLEFPFSPSILHYNVGIPIRLGLFPFKLTLAKLGWNICNIYGYGNSIDVQVKYG